MTLGENVNLDNMPIDQSYISAFAVPFFVMSNKMSSLVAS